MRKTSKVRRTTRYAPRVEGMETRVVPGPFGLPISLPGLLGRLRGVKDLDATGLKQLLSALQGGAGREFMTLIRRQVRNPISIIGQFATGARTTFDVPGFAARTPKLMDTYTGPQLDQFNPTAAGAAVLANGTLSLGAIMRGPIDRPELVRYVWGFDLGRGATTPFPEAPNIKADALVTVERVGTTSLRVFVTDLTNGSTHDLSTSSVKIQGPTVRLRLNPAADLPGGANIRNASFAFWTQSGEGGIETVGRFLPDRGIPVGVLRR